MARARSFATVTACCAVSNPAWCRIFREISCFSHFNIGTLFRCCVLGQGTLSSHASLDSGLNEYLVGQRWQCVRLVPSAEMADAVCSKKEVEMVLHERYIRTHHYYYYYSTHRNTAVTFILITFRRGHFSVVLAPISFMTWYCKIV